MEKYELSISRLKIMDLASYPYEEVKKEISGFGPFGIINMTLHKGKSLIRARPNDLNGEPFSTRSSLSYTPPEFNKRYQRASTPNQTMFYAGTIPENIQQGELDNARIIATMEASHLLRNVGHEGEQKITYSRWIVTDDIPLVAICYANDLTHHSSHTKELYENYHASIGSLNDEPLKKRSLAITEFLAQEFAKKDVDPDYKYMISAIYSEMAVSKGMAGMYFPSVRADYKGFNVAISPAYADRCLKLVAAGECTIYKYGENTMVDNETVCLITDEQKPFVMEPVPADMHIGKEKIMEELKKR